MRAILGLAVALAAAAQTAPFTLDQVLGAPFPSELTAAPAGGKFAWVSNSKGVRNILVADPPSYIAQPITSYTLDDGQEISNLRWTADGAAIFYVRGGGARSGIANPARDPNGAEEAVWMVPLAGRTPRRIGEGDSPAASPKGNFIAFLRGGQIWISAEGGAPVLAFKGRGQPRDLTWSPDGSRLAFTSGRGDHSLIGVYARADNTVRYLDASTDFDSYPEWSPDGRSIAFVRQPSTGFRTVREAHREGEPWSIRVASVDTGEGRAIWTAKPGPGSVFRRMSARNQILWGAGDRIVFPWEAAGWLHLYAVAASGGPPLELTPGALEIEDVVLNEERRVVLFSSNQDDIDRRHIWWVELTKNRPVPITSGEGIEVAPAQASGGGAIAFLASGARQPLHPAIRIGGDISSMASRSLPADFPLQKLVAPQKVVFKSADGVDIHGQLFLPPNRSGRAPAVVFFHGGPQRQMLLGWHYMYYYANAYAMNQYLAGRGYIVLSINFRSGIGYGLNFREALHYGPSGASEYNDVKAAGDYLRSRSDVDPARIGAWGGSYGGYLTAMALARGSDVFKAGADFHGVHDWARELVIPVTEPDYKLAFESSPMNFVRTWKSPVLLIAGDDDPDVQFNQTVMLADALRRQGVHVEELIVPDEVHDFLLYRTWRDSYAATVRFFDRWLK